MTCKVYLDVNIDVDPCGGGCSDQSNPAVRDAYWYASQLMNAGWVIRRIGNTSDGSFFVAETPGRRVVTVDAFAFPETDPATRFANSITALAAEGGDDLNNLVRLLREHAPLRQPATLKWRTWQIPGVPASIQPIPKIRAAYWFAVTLTDEYGWTLSDIGSPTAGGGFIAEIPGETVAIYPAAAPDDRTVASALAHLLAQMTAAETAVVAALVNWHSSVCQHEERNPRSRTR